MERSFLYCIILLCTFFLQTTLLAQNELNRNNSELVSKQSDIDDYNGSFQNTNIDSIVYHIEVAKEACLKAEELKDYNELFEALINLGEIYQKQYRYELAIKSFFKALHLSDSLKNTEGKAKVLHEIGSVYLYIRSLDLAHEYFSNALKIKKGLIDKRSLASTQNSLALTYWLQGHLDTALNHLFRTLELEKDIKNVDGIARCYNNIGIVYHEKNNYTDALTYLNKSLEIKRGTNDFWATAETLNNLGENYISQKKYSKAVIVLTEAQQIAKKINALILLSDNYRYFSRLYKQTNKYKEALTYYELFITLEDSLFGRDKYSIISELKSSFEIEKKEKDIQLQNKKIELLEEKKKSDRLQKLILAGLTFSIISIGGIFFFKQKKINQRNKLLLKKDQQIQKAQALLVESERKEKERLEKELVQKNKFMIDFALYIGMKNELLIKVKDRLKKMARRSTQHNELRPIVHSLNQSLRHNTELIDFQENVEKVNIDFVGKLKEKYPDITENEKQLAILLRLNFSSKEIADFRVVSIKAVEMSRYRLRKKFELDKSDSLQQFIQSL